MAPLLSIAASVFATIFVGFGVNAIIRPDNALTFFELDYPMLATHRNLVDALMVVYGVRDIFMGAAIYMGTIFGSRKTLGFILLAASAVAAADGYVCKTYVGKGEWNHWGYAPMVALVGTIFLGT